MQSYMKKLFSPITLVAFVILVAILAANTNLGTDGITYAAAIAAASIIAFLALVTLLRRKFNEMLDGKPNMADFAVAPGGYRRARQAETEEEAARQSVVTPTPNRPLVDSERTVEAVPTRSLAKATPRSVERYEQVTGRELQLATGCTPPIELVIGRAVLFLGLRGSGKTNALARFLEQVCRFPIPSLICDYEEGFLSFSNQLSRCVIAGSPTWQGQSHYTRYWRVSTKNAEMLGYSILEYGVQAVLQIGTYDTLEEAAQIMTAAIRGMFRWAEEQEPSARVPALICLDEAQHFLPQNSSVSNIKEEQARELLKAFMDVNARGRKRGLTPVIATQRPAQIRKEVIAGSEIYFLMKQTNPRDLDAYEELIGRMNLNRQMVASFQRGEAIVFEGGESWPIRFLERESEHSGHTPTLTQALKRYGERPPAITSATLVAPDEEEMETDDLEEGEQDEEKSAHPVMVPATRVLDAQEPPLMEELQPNPHQQKLTALHHSMLEHYHPGMGYRALGELIGVGKDKAGDLIKDLKKWGYLEEEGE